MIKGAEITIWSELGDNLSFDLTPIQLEAVCKMLGLEFERGSFTCFSDEGLKMLMGRTIDKIQSV